MRALRVSRTLRDVCAIRNSRVSNVVLRVVCALRALCSVRLDTRLCYVACVACTVFLARIVCIARAAYGARIA